MAVLVIWLLPTVVGHTPFVSWIAKRVAADVNGHVEVQSASLGWFSPIKLYGLKIMDPEDRSVIDVSEVRGDRSLVAILWDAADLGRFRLESPKFTAVFRDNGSNVRDVFAKYLTAGERKPMAVAVEIADGSVSVEDTRSQRTWQVDRLALDFTMPADRSRPWELKTSGLLAGSPEGGSFGLTMRMQQASDGAVHVSSVTETRESGESSGPDSINLKTEGLSLELFDTILRRAMPGMHLAGRLSGDVQYRWDSRRPDRRATLEANAVAKELKLVGPNVQVSSGRVQLAVSGRPGEEGMVWKGRLEVSNVTASKGGRPVTWPRPILITLAAKQTAQGPVIEDFKCESGFLKMQASGTPSHLQRRLAVLLN